MPESRQRATEDNRERERERERERGRDWDRQSRPVASRNDPNNNSNKERKAGKKGVGEMENGTAIGQRGPTARNLKRPRNSERIPRGRWGFPRISAMPWHNSKRASVTGRNFRCPPHRRFETPNCARPTSTTGREFRKNSRRIPTPLSPPPKPPLTPHRETWLIRNERDTFQNCDEGETAAAELWAGPLLDPLRRRRWRRGQRRRRGRRQ